MACPIGWSPSVRAPVFFGFEEYPPGGGLPTAVRVFFPSIDSEPARAPLLADCGRYPLVLFAHGQCPSDRTHYRQWTDVPRVLARCGYVVAVPNFGDTSPFGERHLGWANDVIAWMRGTWEHRGSLAATTAAAGHSYGGVLAGRLTASGAASAYVSLSGEWGEAGATPFDVLASIQRPSLFTWGTGLDNDAMLEGPKASLWDKVAPPKHRVRFIDGAHFDYLEPGQSACASGARGPCGLVGAVAADMAALFLSRYLPPPNAGVQRGSVVLSLTPPALDLTPPQQFFASGHLAGLHALASHRECVVSFEEDGGELGFTPPVVRFPSVAVGVERTKILTVQNRTGVTLRVTGPRPRSSPSGFDWTTFDADIAPGATREISITFLPLRPGRAQISLGFLSTRSGIRHRVTVRGLAIGTVPV